LKSDGKSGDGKDKVHNLSKGLNMGVKNEGVTADYVVPCGHELHVRVKCVQFCSDEKRDPV
jgi:hypothetical protein